MAASLLEGTKETLLSRLHRKVRAVRQHTKIHSLLEKAKDVYQSSQEQTAPLLNDVGDYLTDVDDRWQLFVHTRIDPLLGGKRSQQLGELGIQMSTVEKSINRRLLFSVGNIGVAWAATSVMPPLAIINAGMMVWLGMPIYQRGWLALVNEKRLTYPVVLAGAAATTILSGQYVPGSVMMFAITATNKVINRTENYFRRNIVDALGQQPSTVWRLRDNVAVETPLPEIHHGDVLLVGAGEMIAVDGTIVDGAATVDQHRLTGESQPAEKTVGDEVLASTVVLSGKIRVHVQKTGQETSAAQIATILQNVSRSRINFSSRMDNFADSMTAPILTLGGLAMLTMGPVSAAAIMSVGVGSLARVGVPLATLNYLNVAARHGLLIKDARSMELLKNVNTFVFDKTGTLTLEQPQVRSCHPCLPGHPPDSEAWNEAENLLLAVAAAAEARQSHPIARAIMTAAKERKLTIPEIEDAHLELGYGIKVRLSAQQVTSLATNDTPLSALLHLENESHVWVGSRRFLEMEGFTVPAELAGVQERCHEQGHSLVFVAINKHQGMFVAINDSVAGALELRPTVRPEARKAIAALQKRGMVIYIISGDAEAPTRQLALSLGIEHHYAGVLPQQKAGLVDELKARGNKVCFVGDGINDAIAMGRADVSVSLLGASTLATDTAQIVLMNQDLNLLAFMMSLADEFDGSLVSLFRATLVPVSAAVASTFLLQTGTYTALLIWQMGIASGIGMGFRPLWKYRQPPTAEPISKNEISGSTAEETTNSQEMQHVEFALLPPNTQYDSTVTR